MGLLTLKESQISLPTTDGYSLKVPYKMPIAGSEIVCPDPSVGNSDGCLC